MQNYHPGLLQITGPDGWPIDPKSDPDLITKLREEIDAQLGSFRGLGRDVLASDLAATIDNLKVRDKLLQALGAIEQTTSEEQAEVVRIRADTYALSARDCDCDLSTPDWEALDNHIRERVAAKRSKAGGE